MGTNKVSLIGKIASNFQYSHKAGEECYYTAELGVERRSGWKDYIPILVSGKFYELPKDGGCICVDGQFRSHNWCIDGRSRLILNVFALKMEILDINKTMRDKNEIYLKGYICKEPVYRRTPKGRKIADILVAVNSFSNHSDYIPCICWGENARIVSNLPVGSCIQIWGRIQSRIYLKKADGLQQERTAYEVSVSKIEYTYHIH